MTRLLLLLPLLAAACTATGVTAPAVQLPAQPGLTGVVGQDATGLQRLFGSPNADVREGSARKLQYAGAICVLDAYLYPGAAGGEPHVTWIDTRQRDGSPIDRASCVAALQRRDGGR